MSKLIPYKGYRDRKNMDELSNEFKTWVLAQHEDMKWDMMDTTHAKRDTWMFSRLCDLFMGTPIEQGGLCVQRVAERYTDKNKGEQ
jgi:hypothetical protein